MKFCIIKKMVAAASMLGVCASGQVAQAQPAQGGVVPLPRGINKVVSIDAHNTLLIEIADPETPDKKEYRLVPVNHVYSGGIARVLGGDIVPTGVLVSPAYNNGLGMLAGPNRSGLFASGGNTVNNGFGGLGAGASLWSSGGINTGQTAGSGSWMTGIR